MPAKPECGFKKFISFFLRWHYPDQVQEYVLNRLPNYKQHP